MLYACGDFWPHERIMERVTILDMEYERKVPFYRPPHPAARL